jgi:glycosyltransferase involved in cell wall biosynthesis
MIEAMSAGCLVIGSDTAPVREVLNADNGVLVPFFDSDAIARTVVEALADRRRTGPLRARARRDVMERYDMRRICVPAALALIDRKPVAGWMRAPRA